MAHLPPFSARAASTIAAQRIVAADQSAGGFVYTTASLSAQYVGVTVDENRDTNTSLAVARPGDIAKVLFNDTVSSGALVTSDASGRGVPFTEATASAGVIGTLRGDAVAATGTIAEVYINPHRISAG